MNTSAESTALNIAERPPPVRAAPHATHKFKLLLKREFWEHKGGFFWAPIWAGAISLVLTLMALLFAEVAAPSCHCRGQVPRRQPVCERHQHQWLGPGHAHFEDSMPKRCTTWPAAWT